MLRSRTDFGAMTSNTQILPEERRAALNAVLESKEFSRAPALAKLLTYVCEKTFEGRVHEIKEFSIATEVYVGRPTSCIFGVFDSGASHTGSRFLRGSTTCACTFRRSSSFRLNSEMA